MSRENPKTAKEIYLLQLNKKAKGFGDIVAQETRGIFVCFFCEKVNKCT